MATAPVAEPVAAPVAARSCVDEVPAFYPLALNSPKRTYATRSATQHKTPPSAIKRSSGQQNTPGSTGHSVKRAKPDPARMNRVLEPRVLQFNASPPPAPAPAQEEEWVFDACDVVPLIPGLREAEFYRAEFEIPEPFGSVLSILPLCDTMAE